MNLSEKLTVLILTYNRYDRLLRLLKYIDSHHPSFSIYILDSSSDSFDALSFQLFLQRNNIHHLRFDSSIQPLQKAVEGLKRVSTPYVVLWADDDFMVPRAFEVGVEFLDKNKDFSFVHGQSAIFQSHSKNKTLGVDSFSYYPQRDIIAETAGERLLNHLYQYTCIFYSIYRIEILKKGMQMCVDYPFSFNFDEIAPSCFAVIHGKGKKLNQLYMLRERHEGAGISWRESVAGETGFFDWVTSSVFAKDCWKMIQLLGKELAAVDKISAQEGEKIVEQAIWKYVADGMKRKWKGNYRPPSKIRQRLRQFKTLHSFWMYLRSYAFGGKDQFLLPALKRKSSSYYQDFQSVYQWIQKEDRP